MATITIAPATINGSVAPTTTAAEDEQLYEELLCLQDSVLAGRHRFTLPPDVVEQLRASNVVPKAANTSAFPANQSSVVAAKSGALPGLGAQPALDPIFLQKSHSLVKAESQLKRQRLERDLQIQAEQHRHTRHVKEVELETPSLLDVGAVLEAAQQRVKPVSGLKPLKSASVSSFDENDYYSSRAPSSWSSESSSKTGSDRGAGAGAVIEDFERLDDVTAQSSRVARKRAVPGVVGHTQPENAGPRVYNGEDDDFYEPEDEDADEEYSPPDAGAFDASREHAPTMPGQQTPLADEDSDYEPGEITQESGMPTPSYAPPVPAAQPSPAIPVIRNHLTHLAAPQPSRVSPLATAKAPNYELELINGRPEVVQKGQPQPRIAPMQSRASTASPSNAAGLNKKKRKKRKRDQEPSHRAKKRRDRQGYSPASPAHQEPYIKDEPISPPPFVADVPAYQQHRRVAAPALSNAVSPGYPAMPVYVEDTPRSALRCEYAPPISPAPPRVVSMGGYRPLQRDTQDLRRLVSSRYAPRPASPPQRFYTPVAPYRTALTAQPEAAQDLQYASTSQTVQSVRYSEVPQEPRQPSPPILQDYSDPYARVARPAIVAQSAPRRIISDQYGHRYYAAEPASPAARASIAPVDRYGEASARPTYERAPSRMATGYPPASAAGLTYEIVEPSTAAPSTPAPAPEQYVEYVDSNGYRVRQYTARPRPDLDRYAADPTSPVYREAPRYTTVQPSAPQATVVNRAPIYQEVPRYETAASHRTLPHEPTSPVYQQAPRYETMAPPPPRAAAPREMAPPAIYQSVPRAYSVRPQEAPPSAASYTRQASVVPVCFSQQPSKAPPALPFSRAMSLAPQPAPQAYAPAAPAQSARYIDEYGRYVDIAAVRQSSVAPWY